jgi:hypothetical protein
LERYWDEVDSIKLEPQARIYRQMVAGARIDHPALTAGEVAGVQNIVHARGERGFQLAVGARENALQEWEGIFELCAENAEGPGPWNGV